MPFSRSADANSSRGRADPVTNSTMLAPLEGATEVSVATRPRGAVEPRRRPGIARAWCAGYSDAPDSPRSALQAWFTIIMLTDIAPHGMVARESRNARAGARHATERWISSVRAQISIAYSLARPRDSRRSFGTNFSAPLLPGLHDRVPDTPVCNGRTEPHVVTGTRPGCGLMGTTTLATALAIRDTRSGCTGTQLRYTVI